MATRDDLPDVTLDTGACGATAPRLINFRLFVMFLAMFGAMSSFWLLLSPVAMYARSTGAGDVAAGLSTGVLMLATIGAELATPLLVDFFGQARVFAASLLMLGIPAFVLLLSNNTTLILALSAVRGVGFGVNAVIGAAVVASLLPASRRGEGLGLYGIVLGVPGIVALPLGAWVATRAGYPSLFIAGALAALGGLIAAPSLRNAQTSLLKEQFTTFVVDLWAVREDLPTQALAASALAVGVGITYLPLAVSGTSMRIAPLALLVHSVTATLSRWWAGRRVDRNGPARILVSGVLVVAAGVLGLVMVSSPLSVVIGMALLGAGFGAVQSATMALMFSRASVSQYGNVSAVWNLAYDLGWGIGAATFGVLAVHTGYAVAFAILAIFMVSTSLVVWLRRASI